MYSNITEAWNNDPLKEITEKTNKPDKQPPFNHLTAYPETPIHPCHHLLYCQLCQLELNKLLDAKITDKLRQPPTVEKQNNFVTWKEMLIVGIALVMLLILIFLILLIFKR